MCASDTRQTNVFRFSERVMTMSQSKIKLNATEEVQEFVNAASRCDFDIDVYYNRFLIDAKSILGMLGIGQNDVVVRYAGNNENFENIVDKFALA